MAIDVTAITKRPIAAQTKAPPSSQCVLSPRSPPLALAFFTFYQCRLGGQLLQPFGQAFELLVCTELVQAVNADLNRLGVVVGDTVDVFGSAHDLLIVAGAFLLFRR